MYISPDWPTLGNGTFTTNWTYQDPNQNQQNFFYGGYNGYPTANDPNSRINQTTFNWGANPYAQPQTNYGYQQQQAPAPAVTPLQPFSSYGGSGNQQMPTLNNMPTLNSAVLPQPTPMNAPTFNQPAYYQNPNAPLFNAQIPTFDKRTECWGNQFVQPQQLPVPNIDWNKPAQQPYANPMQPFQSFPSFNQPQTFQDNWTEMYKRNIAAAL